jgi:hypothetical protein
MNLKKEFDGDGTPRNANDMMDICMEAIHESLMVPMQGKLTIQQNSLLAIVEMTLKLIAEKASLYEAEHEGNDDLGNLNKNHRN